MTYNAAVSVVQTSNVLIEGNVAYYTLGSTYWVRSTGNTVAGNLGIRTVLEVTHNDAVQRSDLACQRLRGLAHGSR